MVIFYYQRGDSFLGLKGLSTLADVQGGKFVRHACMIAEVAQATTQPCWLLLDPAVKWLDCPCDMLLHPSVLAGTSLASFVPLTCSICEASEWGWLGTWKSAAQQLNENPSKMLQGWSDMSHCTHNHTRMLCRISSLVHVWIFVLPYVTLKWGKAVVRGYELCQKLVPMVLTKIRPSRWYDFPT